MKRFTLCNYALIVTSLWVTGLCHANTLSVPQIYPAIQIALDAASQGDTIVVNPGNYLENIIWPNTQSLKLFSAGDASNTFINADFSGRGITFTGQITLDSNTIIRGFGIRNGFIDTVWGYGGGIYLKNANIKLEELHIYDNTVLNYSASGYAYGGGVFCMDSNPIIAGCIIETNWIFGTTSCGGGIYCMNSTLTLRNSSVNYNSIGYGSVKGCNHGKGGGIGILGNSNLYIEDSEISYNYCGDSIGSNKGGGIYSEAEGEIIMKNVTVAHNRLGDFGGWNYGGGMDILRNSLTHLENIRIDSNATGKDAIWQHGGGLNYYIDPGVQCPASKLVMINVKVRGNFLNDGGTFYFGGGVNIENCDSIVACNLLVTDNIMGLSKYTLQRYYGSAISVRHSKSLSEFILVNGTIANNRTSLPNPFMGSAIHLDDSTFLTSVNSIIYNPGLTDEVFAEPNNFTASYSNIRNCNLQNFTIDADPKFIGAGDYHLQFGSPCIGKGTPLFSPGFDIDNNPRPLPLGTNPDMGAYEDPIFIIGIEKESVISGSLTIFPNPATFSIQISGLDGMESTYSVYDIHGKPIMSGSLSGNSGEIIVEHLPAGIYTIMLYNQDKTHKKMFVRL